MTVDQRQFRNTLGCFATGIVVATSGRIITLLGVHDIVVVDTPDALLVTTKEHAQDVKQVVEQMRAEGLDGVL